MRKLSAPIAITQITPENLGGWIERAKKSKLDRVFLCGIEEFYSSETAVDASIKKCADLMPHFLAAGIDVGIWVNSFGHGLADITNYDEKGRYQGFVGENGETPSDCFCPSDKELQRDFLAFVKKIAAIKPSVLMIDDDFRLGQRTYALGCFCPNHMADICRRLGEEISREELVKKAFSGGPNRYRDAYIASMNDTLVGFAKMLREGVDEVYPEMRLGICMCFDVWDTEGTDAIEIANALAGGTKPYLRANGAPYWQVFCPTGKDMWGWGSIISAIEYNRVQSAWCHEYGIECMGEGDTYPRPRYTVPANYLEIFDLALVANGELTDGLLKYMYDYRHALGFEDGYGERHERNEKSREALAEIFEGKRAIGVRVFEHMKRLRDTDFGEQYPGWSRDALYSFFSRGQYPMSHNGIPTAYYGCKGAVVAFGENARHLPRELMKFGVITDAVGAKILTERGFDVGFKGFEYETYSLEKYPTGDVIMFEKVATVKLECKEGAEVTSVFSPSGSPATYRYENADGVKFFVMAYDSYRTPPYMIAPDYIVDYNRQAQLMDAIEWIENKPLIAKSKKHPFLYTTAYRNDADGSVALGLFNVFADSIYECEIELGEEFGSVKFVNCEGVLDGRTVRLKGEISPFSFAALELKK